MWRDLERICAREGLGFARPSGFPRNSLLAARVALIAADEGWCGDFTRAVYRANFAEDRDIAEPEVIAGILAALGRPAPRILTRAGSPRGGGGARHFRRAELHRRRRALLGQ